MRYALIVLAFVVVAAFQNPIYAALPMEPLGDAAWPVFFFLYAIITPLLVMSLVGGGIRQIIGDLGVLRNPIPALLFGLLVTAPALAGFALKLRPSPTLDAGDLLMGCLFYPFVEETFFRGFLFGQLYKRAGWSFWPAALTPAVVFALAHLYQSQDPAEIAGIFAITALGSVVFSYIFVQWGGNIWAPFAGHALLNLYWSVFAVDDTALGGTYANALRFAAIALAVAFCFVAPRFGWLKPLKRGGDGALRTSERGDERLEEQRS